MKVQISPQEVVEEVVDGAFELGVPLEVKEEQRGTTEDWEQVVVVVWVAEVV